MLVVLEGQGRRRSRRFGVATAIFIVEARSAISGGATTTPASIHRARPASYAAAQRLEGVAAVGVVAHAIR